MKKLFALVVICLSSCTTQKSFKVTKRSAEACAFEAVYRPYNSQGGDSVWGFAHAARDFSVDSVIAEGLKSKIHAEKITLTDASVGYSLSGYYTFTIAGNASFARTAPAVLTIYDETNLIHDAKLRARRNQVTKAVLSPVITAIDTAIYGGANMPISKHAYIMRNGD